MNAQRKRVKRQVAGQLVTGLLGAQTTTAATTGGGSSGSTGAPKITPSGKKSVAQPRPQVCVPPRGIGPILEPNDMDVLCGRGGRINAHIGNVRFRDMVLSRKDVYLSPATKKLEKAHIAAQVVQDIRARGGRFLKEESNGAWYDIGDAKAIKKVGQALREDAPDLRPQDDLSATGDLAGSPVPAKPLSSSGSNSSVNNNNTSSSLGVAKGTISLPRQAVNFAQAAPPASATGGGSDTGSSIYEPIAYVPPPPSHNMSPPSAVQVAKISSGGGGGFASRFGRRENHATMSGVAAALMEQDDVPPPTPPTMGGDNPPVKLAFGRAFHAPENNETSVISGLTNTMVSGMSGLSDEGRLSSLSAAAADRLRQQFQQQQQQAQRPQPTYARATHSFEVLRAQQLHQLRQTWAATNSNRTLPHSDLAARAVMPAHHALPPPQPYPVQRSNSWQDAASVDVMSWADHSLVGGGIQDISSVVSARSFASHQMRNDTDSLMEQLMQTSLASAGRKSQRSYAQNLYRPIPLPSLPAPQASAGASVTSMSLASDSGLASLDSVRSIMSDLSETLVALDLAESRALEELL